MPINHHNQGEVMTTRIEKTVFISYRRTNFPWAYCIYQDLTHHGYDVFFDYQSIDSGSFEKVILENIRARAHFIIILSPSALEKCNQPGDWLRREIETAIDEERNIIPVMLEGFDFGSPLVKQALTGKLSSLSGINGMSLVAEYVEAGFEKLRNRFLSVALEDVHLHALTEDTKEITITQQTSANEAPPVEKRELTAQEWFERAFVFSKEENSNEAIRCSTNAITLQPNFADAYYIRGYTRYMSDDHNEALSDFNNAIIIDPNHSAAHATRAVIREEINDLDGAIEDYTYVIQAKDLGTDVVAETYHRRGTIYHQQREAEHALQDFNKAIELAPNLATYYISRGKIHFTHSDFEAAIADFDTALKIESENCETYFARGLARGMKKDSHGAFEDVEKAIQLKPDYVEAYHLRALIHANVKNWKSSIADYQKYLELNGGIKYGDQKEIEEKIKDFKSKLVKKKSTKKKKSQ